MENLENRRKKPVNIYAQGTATQKAQAKMNANVTAAARGIGAVLPQPPAADFRRDAASEVGRAYREGVTIPQKIGGAAGMTMRQAVTLPVAAAHSEVIEPLTPLAIGIGRAVKGVGQGMYEAGRTFVTGKTGPGPAPQQPTAAVAGQPSAGPVVPPQEVVAQPQQAVAQGVASQGVAQPAAARNPAVMPQRQVDQPRQGLESKGVQRIGNLNVRFADGTPMDARQRFAAVPQETRVRQQIAQPTEGGGGGPAPYKSGPINTIGDALRERSRRRDALINQGNMTAQAAADRTQTDRARVDLDRDRMGIDQQRVGLDEKRVGLDEQRLGLEREGQRENIGIAKTRSELDARNTQSTIEGRDIETQAKRDILSLQQAYLAESDATDPEGTKRALVMKKLQGIGAAKQEPTAKYQTLDQFDEYGTKTGQVLYDQTTGRIVDRAAGQPSANHAKALRANPALAAQFDAIYGAGASKQILGERQ